MRARPAWSSLMKERVSRLIQNASIVTMDSERRIFERDGALAMADNLIVAVGTTQEITDRYCAEDVIDGTGKALIPGLIDLHFHSAMTRGFADDLQLEEFLESVAPEALTMTPDDHYHAGRLAYLEAIKSGTTCVNEMFPQLSRLADAVEESGIRAKLSCFAIGEGALAILAEHEELIPKLQNRANGRVTTSVGLEMVSVVDIAAIRKAKEVCDRFGIGLHVHVNETEADNIRSVAIHGKNSIQVLSDEGLLNERCILAHCVVMSDEEIELVRKSGSHVAHNPLSNSKCGMGIAPVPAMMKAGINVGFGHDAAWCSNSRNIFEAMKFGALLQKATKADASIMPAETIMEMATINSARALGLGDEIGSLEVGKKADITMLDMTSVYLSPYITTSIASNLVSNIVYSMQTEAVDTVIIDGQIVMQGREVKTLNESAVCNATTVAARRLVERIL